MKKVMEDLSKKQSKKYHQKDLIDNPKINDEFLTVERNSSEKVVKFKRKYQHKSSLSDINTNVF